MHHQEHPRPRGCRRTPSVVHLRRQRPGYDLVANAAYQNIVSDYRTTFQRLGTMPCEIVLAPHGEMFDLAAKRQRLLQGDANAFYDPEG